MQHAARQADLIHTCLSASGLRFHSSVVEQGALNLRVLGSNPSGITKTFPGLTQYTKPEPWGTAR